MPRTEAVVVVETVCMVLKLVDLRFVDKKRDEWGSSSFFVDCFLKVNSVITITVERACAYYYGDRLQDVIYPNERVKRSPKTHCTHYGGCASRVYVRIRRRAKP